MYPVYEDIRERLGEPLWHDQHGVPRYAPFQPRLLGIYDDWACLFVVQCQGCPQRFDCAAGFSFSHHLVRDELLKLSEDEVKAHIEAEFAKKDDPLHVLPKFVAWGDAPWHGECQCAGTTMSTDIIGIREIWHRVPSGERSYPEWTKIEITAEIIEAVCDL